jgi:hypothetical protein
MGLNTALEPGFRFRLAGEPLEPPLPVDVSELPDSPALPDWVAAPEAVREASGLLARLAGLLVKP